MPSIVNFDHTQFDEIANQILNHHVLIVKNKTFNICEIEFYYKNKDHNDEYTHCSEQQATNGLFYFHQYKNKTYKNGTYKGMDLTFGNNNLFCGVLIRSIYDPENNEFIEGPCRSVNKILELNGFNDVKNFMVDKDDIPLYKPNDHLYLKYAENPKPLDVFKGKRVGLSEKYPEYLEKQYRYATMVNKIKKQKTFQKLHASS